MADKKWEKPKLTVLVRSKPEEMVLSHCKSYIGGYASGPSADASACNYNPYGGCGSACSTKGIFS